MDDNYIINKIIDILNSQNQNLLIGNITSPRPGSICQVNTPYGIKSAYNINCTYPGDACVVWDKDENRYYAFSINPSRVINSKQLSYRKNREIPKKTKLVSKFAILYYVKTDITYKFYLGGCFDPAIQIYEIDSTVTPSLFGYISLFSDYSYIVGLRISYIGTNNIRTTLCVTIDNTGYTDTFTSLGTYPDDDFIYTGYGTWYTVAETAEPRTHGVYCKHYKNQQTDYISTSVSGSNNSTVTYPFIIYDLNGQISYTPPTTVTSIIIGSLLDRVRSTYQYNGFEIITESGITEVLVEKRRKQWYVSNMSSNKDIYMLNITPFTKDKETIILMHKGVMSVVDSTLKTYFRRHGYGGVNFLDDETILVGNFDLFNTLAFENPPVEPVTNLKNKTEVEMFLLKINNSILVFDKIIKFKYNPLPENCVVVNATGFI